MKKIILTAAASVAAIALSACSSEPAADETVVEVETPAAEELAAPTDVPTDAATDAAAEASPAATESPAM